MHTNQQQAIDLMNNKAATSLALGQELEAIASLRGAFDILAVLCGPAKNTKRHSCGKGNGGDSASAQQQLAHRIYTKRFVYPLSNKVGNFASVSRSSNSFFVYNNCFVLGEKDDADVIMVINCESRQMAIKSAATIYNMALAYHRLALASPKCRHHGAWTYKAITFYKQAIGLVLPDIHHDSQCTEQQHIDAAVIAIAAYNNMGQISFDLLSNNEGAKGCFQAFDYLLRYSPFVRDSMQHDLRLCSDDDEECLLFRKTDWDGLLANLFFVDMMSASVAAAA